MPRGTIDRFEQRKLTRAKLVEAALKLFSTSGYEHATVDDIAREAGYSKGAYYFHFSTKEDILIELLRMWTEDRTAALASSDEGLRDVVARFVGYDGTPWPAVLLEFWSQAARNHEVGTRLRQAYGGWRRQLAEAFDAAAASGALRSGSGEEFATVVIAAHDGYAVQTAVGAPGGKLMSPEELADALVAPLEEAEEAGGRRTAAI